MPGVIVAAQQATHVCKRLLLATAE
jgi:hypothetical protein